jgi:iduronate 2-sulfatase
LILVDDLKPAIGAYGDDYAITPNLDRLAARGMRFENAFANQAVCMASRYNLMLGARSTSTGFYNFGSQFRDVYPDAVTLPQHFKNAGYHAESMGKVYHIGHGNEDDAASWSVPHYKDKVIDYVLPESTNRQLTREEAFFTNARTGVPNRELPRGAAWEAADVLDEAYADGRVATHAISRLEKLAAGDQPFFMAVGFARPHLPFSAPKKYWDLYDRARVPLPEFEQAPEGAPPYAVKRRGEITQYTPVPEDDTPFSEQLKRNLILGYYASTSYMDAQLGRLLDAVDRLGLADDTVIALWGDHGFHLGDHGSWTKHSNHEQAVRIPLIIVAPGKSRAGSVTGQPAETVDLYPTLAELAGLGPPSAPQPIDGISLVPVLKNPEQRIRDHAYHAYLKRTHLGQAIRTERYRMVQWTHRESGEKEYELYDYRDDPLETRNLAPSKPDVLQSLIGMLERHPPARDQAPRRRSG